jgi:hypothetical protein
MRLARYEPTHVHRDALVTPLAVREQPQGGGWLHHRPPGMGDLLL